MKIGDRLTQLRNKKGLTQDQLAEALGVKRARYNSWENNIAKPDIEMIAKLAALHKVSADYIIGVDTPTPEWATYKDKRDFKNMLEDNAEVMFDGVPISDNDKEKIKRVMEAMFWDAKKKNKRKPTE